MTEAKRRVVVIGGGLAGLCAAHGLSRAGRSVAVFEAGPRLGGQIRTERADGCVVEHGAEGFVARSEAVPALARLLGIDGALIDQATLRSYGWDGAALQPLAPGEAGRFLGLQVPDEDLGKGIRSFRAGMAELTDALESALVATGTELATSALVDCVERTAHGIVVRTLDDSFEAEHVVVATSAAAAAALLEPLAGAAALALADAPTLSSVTVTLEHTRRQVPHPLDATGFVVAPDIALHGARACTFVSSKFAERAPADTALLRVFFRPEPGELAGIDEMAWTEKARQVLRETLDVHGMPLRSWVSRWPDALPVHTPAHRDAIAALERALAGTGIALAGSAFHGAGIDAALRSAERAIAATSG